MPQAMERSFATPIIRPRLPAISGPGLAMSRANSPFLSLSLMAGFIMAVVHSACCGRRRPTIRLPTPPFRHQHQRLGANARFSHRVLSVMAPEHKGCVGPSEAETVGHDAIERHLVQPLDGDRYPRKLWIE